MRASGLSAVKDHNDESCWVLVPVGQRASGGWVDDVLRARAREAPLRGKSGDVDPGPRQRIEVFRGRDAQARVNARYYQRGWTDGLPIVAPTLARVEEMLQYSPLSADHTIGELEPLMGAATVEKLAANAVMAGCLPAYFPVVLAATKALLDPAFNLRGVQTTDENVAPLLIVSGPIADRLGINAGIGALGPGWQANATIGRALRLIMTNIGGGWPGVVSLAGIGQPARYTLCVAEQEDASPWAPLHVDSGFGPGDSTVTLMRAECSINVTGELDDLASVMASAVSAFSVLHGGRVAVLIAPYIAQRLAAEGWSKADVSRYLFEHARIPVEVWRQFWVCKQIAVSYGVPDWVTRAEMTGRIPIVEHPEDIVVFVAGGNAPIAQHVYFPTWGFPPCRVVSPVSLPANWNELMARQEASSSENDG